jgi:hypothetical protein
MSTGPAGGAPSEEQLRAAYEAELKRLRVEQLLLEHVVGMINLGMRRTGLAPGTEDERDPAQVRLAIESVRALMPLLEQTAPQQVGQIRGAVSQLQLAFVRIGGQPGGAGEGAAGEGAAAGAAGAAGAAARGGAAGGGAPGEGAAGAEGGSEPRRPAPGQPGPAPEPARPEGPGPAQRSGRLWVPGQ